MIYLESEYKNDEITLNPESISVIKPAENYVEIYYEREGTPRRHIIRGTLNKAETTTHDCGFLFRCHRSFSFAGTNAYQAKKIISVRETIQQLKEEYYREVLCHQPVEVSAY